MSIKILAFFGLLDYWKYVNCIAGRRRGEGGGERVVEGGKDGE